jgi:hydroxymethylpyrimidine pyrophosphatase-like HAD family hydrolase
MTPGVSDVSDVSDVTDVMVASDLDRTLVFSPRADPSDAHDVEVLQGRVISRCHPGVLAGLEQLQQRVHVVPVTTRTAAQAQRVQLGLRSEWAVVASGAVVLHGGVPVPEWTASVRARLAAGAGAPEVLEALAWSEQRPWWRRTSIADDAFLVLGVTGEPDLDEVLATCEPLGWHALHQGSKLYVLPTALDKAHAVAYVAEQLGAPRVWAAGDSWLDLAMLRAADRAWVPRHCELDAAGADLDGFVVTHDGGHAAARQIVGDWLALSC